MVILPQGRDQADNAVRVASRGAGLTLKSTAATGEIADAVQSVLATRYRQAAERLGACIRTDAASARLSPSWKPTFVAGGTVYAALAAGYSGRSMASAVENHSRSATARKGQRCIHFQMKPFAVTLDCDFGAY